MVGNLGGPELFMAAVLALGTVVVLVLPAVKICAKAGFSPWLGVLALVPVANIGLLFFVAFAPWPTLQDRPRDLASSA